MEAVLMAKAAVLGVVEGLTEFLPVSSTGHLIIVGELLHFNDAVGKVFEIAIQLAAILAVCWEYRARLSAVVVELPRSRLAQRFVVNLFIAFLPAAVVGLLLIKLIKHYLFAPVPVAIALLVGGVLILWAERREHRIRVQDVDDMSWRDALLVGLAQCLALIPGTSRSGATIIGGLFIGLSRRAATEFSFFLAIPTMFAATFYELWKNRALLDAHELPLFLVGGVSAFASAFVAVRGLLRYVSTHDFSVFGWYRIGFAMVVLGTAWSGLVLWSGG